MSNENTYSNLKGEEKQQAIVREITPYFIYAVLPIILTLIIAWVFGPSV